jgi:hypothetical protein
MGLEIAEILMDIEEEFCIFVDVEEGGKMGTLVGDFEDMVVRHYDRERLSTLVIELSEIDDLDQDPRYVNIQSENRWLPPPGFNYCVYSQ